MARRRANTCGAAAFLALAGTLFHTPKVIEDVPLRPLPHHGPIGPRLKKKRHRRPPKAPPVPPSTTATTTTEPPTTTTTTTTSPPVPVQSLEQGEQAWVSSPTVRCIIHAESRNDANWGLVSPDGARGLFQIEPATWQQGAEWARVNPLDHSVANQERVAYVLWLRLGWSPWNGDGCA